jgi:UDP-N-acetylglucosamine--N-acetylmuramyl-(pentapeptide) pyrophosphoryl-undecaprenol N-acetylglucosamine transferase
MSPSLIVTGGGTGGHLFAGIAIADEWKSRFPDSRILFVGAKGGIEERLVPKANYPLDLLRLGSLKGVSTSKRLKTALQLPIALLTAAWILVRERPKAVIGVGGYASGPMVLIARVLGWAWGCKTAILEQNAVPGFTNRILGRFAHSVFCAFPGVESRFQKKKTHITGNPVRKTMVALESANRDPFTIFIFGGSQGAKGINSLVLESLPLLKDLQPRIRWIHQTGEHDFDRVVSGYRDAGVEGRIERFIYDMPECYRQASLIICRAGSSTLAELAAVHRAAILIPFPFASDNHQEKNAKLFVDRSAAELLVQNRAKGQDLAARIRALIESPDLLRTMEANIAGFHAGDAPARIVDLLSASSVRKEGTA